MGRRGRDWLTFSGSASLVDGGAGFDTNSFNADSLRLASSTEIRDSDGKGLIKINNTRPNESKININLGRYQKELPSHAALAQAPA